MELERVSKARLTVCERPDRKWGWQLVSESGWVIAADGGGGFESAHEAGLEARRVVYGEYADVAEGRRHLD